MFQATRFAFRSSSFYFAVLGAALLCVLVSAPSRASAQNFTVTAANMQDYTVNGQPDPVLTLVRGTTYVFSVNTPGHPFYIKTVAGNGTGNQFTDGVTGNGVTSGTLTFVVPLSAPNTLFYQCSVHTAMSGTIQVVSPSSVPVPVFDWRALMLSSLLLLAGGGLILSRTRSGAGSLRRAIVKGPV